MQSDEGTISTSGAAAPGGSAHRGRRGFDVLFLLQQFSTEAERYAGAVLADLDYVGDVFIDNGTVSLIGVYGGQSDPMPMLTMFDKQLQVRMGQCNVRRWTDDLLPLVEDDADPLGVMDLVTHRSGLEGAPALYEKFQKKEDGCIKVVLNPGQ